MRVARAFALSLLFAGCGGATSPPPPVTAASVVPLTDAQLAAALLDATRGEVTVAQAAAPNLEDDAARAFAHGLASEYATAAAREQALFTQLALVPAESDLSAHLRARELTETLTLALQPRGAAYDHYFVCAELDYEGQLASILTGEGARGQDAALQGEADRVREAFVQEVAAAAALAEAHGGCPR